MKERKGQSSRSSFFLLNIILSESSLGASDACVYYFC